MAARRKRIKTKAKRISIKAGPSKKNKTKNHLWSITSLISSFKISIMVCILGGSAVGLLYLEKHNIQNTPVSETGFKLQLADVPKWVNRELQAKALQAAAKDAQDLKIDENAAGLVHQNIEKHFVWLDDLKVQTTHNSLRIKGRWRKPVGLIKLGRHSFYVDNEQVLLDFVQISNLPIVEITGLPTTRKIPKFGEVWAGDDLAEAIKLLELLERRDRIETSQKPLLTEIARLDVSNFEGRKNSKNPHIVLYTKDNTKIIWGAEIDKWQRHLESTDEQKIAKLYSYYKEYGTLSGQAKYINLCDPQDDIPQPIDKY